MSLPDALTARRIRGWRQAPDVRVTTPDEAAAFIQTAGIVTLYPASPEFPDLFRAFMGQPEATTDLDWDGEAHLATTSWDSPASEIYTWRWHLGQRDDLLYASLIRKRPTWVRRDLVAPVLALRGDTRSVADLYAAGLISANAQRIIQALAAAGTVLPTGELRRLANFPTGKEQRAAYQRAIATLEEHLLICKAFLPGEETMGHELMSVRFAPEVEEAAHLDHPAALERIVRVYMATAHMMRPGVFARHFGILPAELMSVLQTLTHQGAVQQVSDALWTLATAD